jgi:hypothetical protein
MSGRGAGSEFGLSSFCRAGPVLSVSVSFDINMSAAGVGVERDGGRSACAAFNEGAGGAEPCRDSAFWATMPVVSGCSCDAG